MKNIYALAALLLVVVSAASAQVREMLPHHEWDGTYFYTRIVAGSYDASGVAREDLEKMSRQILGNAAEDTGFSPVAIGSRRAKQLAFAALEIHEDVPEDEIKDLLEPKYVAVCALTLTMTDDNHDTSLGNIHIETEDVSVELSGTLLLLDRQGAQVKSVDLQPVCMRRSIRKNSNYGDLFHTNNNTEPNRLGVVREVFKRFAQIATGVIVGKEPIRR